jgi:hypothetical protein
LPLARKKTLDALSQSALWIKGARHRFLQAHGSGRLVGLQFPLDAGNGVTQRQTPLLETPHHQLINRLIGSGKINQSIEVGMFYTQLDQMPFRRMKICYQGKWV